MSVLPVVHGGKLFKNPFIEKLYSELFSYCSQGCKFGITEKLILSQFDFFDSLTLFKTIVAKCNNWMGRVSIPPFHRDIQFQCYD